ncbi:ribonucleotide reductase [Maribacter phage Colly_1]|uniref:Ribonucleotide reductase subunit A n=1 Tax=Maribacter phage Colly_1 TaxID=2745691 RepID=A0A8E4UY06_9CAUD|nr:ribonucleotide reductase [Maribacter phage Colly_1]QQO97329.1 ribonucleotide reductase subunit A [Maribacter phage Colly_1]
MKLDFLKDPQIEFLREGLYIREDESPEDRFKEILDRVREYESDYGEGLADRLEYMISKNIFSLSTPALANFGRPLDPEKNTHSLPASCNIITVGNSIADIYHSLSQVAMLSKLGAGVGSDFQSVNSKGTKLGEGFYSNSKLDWIEDSVAAGQKVSQGTQRRGYNTPFISILDPELDDLLARVDRNNPNSNDPLVDNTIGIIMPEGFWEEIANKNKDYQSRWLKVIKAREKNGRIYLGDVRNMNINSSPVYAKLGLKCATTNICTEFIQPHFPDMTSVCVISAFNLMHWDEIKANPQMIKDGFTFLDILNEEYIKLTEGVPFLDRARKAAINKRDIGMGTVGFHEFLQSKGMAYGDLRSRAVNKEIYSTLRKYGEETTKELGAKLGSPKLCQEAGMVRRNCSLMMVAPNKSTSFISGCTSGGIEPFMSNVFLKNLAKIQHVFKNTHLVKLLEEKGMNTRATWDSIEDNNGSVAHLDFLAQDEKDIFKTFAEISPKDIIDLAADRQEFIDMGQSLNLVFRKNYTLKDLHEIHKYAFDSGLKTLYYAYNSAHASLEQDGEAWDTCISCAD